MWKQVSGYENAYLVNEYSVVKRVGGGILKPQKRKDGYYQYQLSLNGKRKMHKVHRLVAIAFVDNPRGLNVVNHKDGDKTNNYYKNLEWCTPAENNQHSWDNGLNHVTEKKRECGRQHVAYARECRKKKLEEAKKVALGKQH